MSFLDTIYFLITMRTTGIFVWVTLAQVFVMLFGDVNPTFFVLFSQSLFSSSLRGYSSASSFKKIKCCPPILKKKSKTCDMTLLSIH